MKFLILGNFHHKNKFGLELILNKLNIEFSYKNNLSDINNFDIIYSPSLPIDTSKFPTKKFIFGPHFSVFPDNKLNKINNIHKNSIYIQPSVWAKNAWINVENIIPLLPIPFPVDTVKFKPNNLIKKEKVFIYFKRRSPNELNFLINFLKNNNINFVIFDYVRRYSEDSYLKYLKESKYGIILDAHESQGFAIEEALSCNVPLLVWNTKFMSQEYNSRYPNIPCSTIPYWDERCGEYFYNQNDFEKTFNLFINKLETYQPRNFIIENLSLDACLKKWNPLLQI